MTESNENFKSMVKWLTFFIIMSISIVIAISFNIMSWIGSVSFIKKYIPSSVLAAITVMIFPGITLGITLLGLLKIYEKIKYLINSKVNTETKKNIPKPNLKKLEDIKYCESIINEFGACLGSYSNKVIARKESTLKYSTDIIELAYANYLKNMKSYLSDDEITALKTTFLSIAHFIPDNLAEKINSVHLDKTKATQADLDLYNRFLKEAYLNPGPKIEKFNSF